MDRSHKTIFISALLVLGAGVTQAFAKEAKVPIATKFDLERHAPASDTERFRVKLESDGTRFPKDQLGPHFTYIPLSGGPTLEVAALGAGRKGTPGLAHVGVDWRF